MTEGFALKLHRLQRLVMVDKHRYRVIVAGRRWGKTVAAKTAIISAAATKKKQIVWYVAPTYQMARDIMWEALKSSIPRAWIKKINETRMTIRLLNGSWIMLKGADKPDSLRGVELHFLVIDEFQDVDKDAWELVLSPTLTSTGGKAIFIGTPKQFNHLYELYLLGQRGDTYLDEQGRTVVNEWASWQFPTRTSPFIPKKEIEAKQRDMDPRSFRQEFEASFETMSGRVYYPFDRRVHVKSLSFDPRLPIYIGMDFNIDPMTAVISQHQPNGDIWVIDEIYLRGSNTEETAHEISRRYWKQIDQVRIYPDPGGATGSTKSRRGESDLDVLRDVGFKNIFYKRKHPAVADRINSVNRLLRAADGSVRMFIDPRCKQFVDSLEQTQYKEGSREVDKKAGHEHITDAFGYFADFEHPVRKVSVGGLSI